MNRWISLGMPSSFSVSVAIQSRDQSAKNTLSSNHAGNFVSVGLAASK